MLGLSCLYEVAARRVWEQIGKSIEGAQQLDSVQLKGRSKLVRVFRLA